MDSKEVFRTYVLPLLLSVLLIVTSLLMGVLQITNVVTAAALFLVVALSVFAADILVSKVALNDERRSAFAFLSSLLLRDRVTATSGLLTLDEVLAIEAMADEVWVYAYDLTWEAENSKIPPVVKANLVRGIPYHYVVPNTGAVQVRVDNLRNRYADVPNINGLIEFRTRRRDEKLVQFGVTIYNPSLLSGGRRTTTETVVVFFPHYELWGPSRGAMFVTLRGEPTIEVQEAFAEAWNAAEAQAPTVSS